MNEAQKQLKDLKCFLTHFDRIQLQILTKDHKYIFDSDVATKDIQILAENPYQLNLIVPIDKDSFKVFHISHEAMVDIHRMNMVDLTMVIIQDKEHSILMAV